MGESSSSWGHFWGGNQEGFLEEEAFELGFEEWVTLDCVDLGVKKVSPTVQK